ncbi:hypothetical protein [Haladaptatus sp. W1]|nr:hypothetical protein [Haladaptatus sp. W1]
MDVEIHDDRLARQMEGEDFVLAVVTATMKPAALNVTVERGCSSPCLR